MNPITDSKALAAFCTEVSAGDYVTVDTEFIREKTYYPKLCLLQIASETAEAVIDPLAPGIDLAPVLELLQRESLVKVFHAPRQDIEIFHLLSGGKIPNPIFDTQIAAAVCGYGESVSYETLVNEIVGSDLDKSSRFTDWAARPLSAKQLEYALSDVTHLRVIYQKLKKQVEDTDRTSWIAEELAYLTDPALYQTDPNDAWKRLKVGNMRPKHLAVLRELARWRETLARDKNVPRGRILKDETLVEIAFSMPRKDADLTRMRGIDRHLGKDTVEAVLGCVETALAMPASEYPQVKANRRLPRNIASPLAMLQLLLKVQADVHGIAAPLIASKDDLEVIALGQTDTPALTGWRYDIFGQKAESLMQGKLKLSLNPKNKQVAFEEVA